MHEYNIVFIPCGHVIACVKCALSFTECPISRQFVSNVFRITFDKKRDPIDRYRTHSDSQIEMFNNLKDRRLKKAIDCKLISMN